MTNDAAVFRFGPFELDSARGLLKRDGQPVPLGKRPVDLLTILLEHAGGIVNKEALADAVWHGAISDSSIDRAVWTVRKVLGDQPDGACYVETVARAGYRFAASVERGQATPPLELDALLAPHEAIGDSRAALDTLIREAIIRAHQALDGAVRSAPNSADAHVEMATACLLRFEATRIDASPDAASLEDGIRHALEGCRLDPASGEAWSTLGFALHRCGRTRSALAAARKAIVQEPDSARHFVRLATVSWGEECISAVRRVLLLYPDLALPHWLAARVFIARRALDAAMEHIRAGCDAQDAQRSREVSRFNAVGLHLLRGLVLASRGLYDDALDAFGRELEFEHDGQLYARECAANTWYSAGAVQLRVERPDLAESSFRETLARIPGHPMATVALRAMGVSAPPATGETNAVCAAMTRAAELVLAGGHDEAARIFTKVLKSAQPGEDGWLLPVEPLINAAAHPVIWTPAFDILRHRA